MPKRLVCTAHDTVTWENYELPAKLEAGQIRVRNTHGAEKHGTKISFVHGHGNKRGSWDAAKQMFVPGGVAWSYPIPLGNMQVGIVEETGSGIPNYKPGDRILYFGAFAPTALITEEETWKLAPDTCWKAATCLDPATFALCALRDGNARIGDSAAIFSLGAIGLMAVQLARLAGCYPVIAIDPFANRREAALKSGADLAIDPVNSDAGQLLRAEIGGVLCLGRCKVLLRLGRQVWLAAGDDQHLLHAIEIGGRADGDRGIRLVVRVGGDAHYCTHGQPSGINLVAA